MFTHFPVAVPWTHGRMRPSPRSNSAVQQFVAVWRLPVCDRDLPLLQQRGHHCYRNSPWIWVRPGVATYGIAPSQDLAGRLDLRPLLTLQTTISPDPLLSCRGAGELWPDLCDSAPRTLAVVSIGYADGLSRQLSGRVSFLLRGDRCLWWVGFAWTCVWWT